MKLTFSIIECLKGWQAEATVHPNWTVYGPVLKDKAKVRAAAMDLCDKFKCECEFEDRIDAELEGKAGE